MGWGFCKASSRRISSIAAFLASDGEREILELLGCVGSLGTTMSVVCLHTSPEHEAFWASLSCTVLLFPARERRAWSTRRYAPNMQHVQFHTYAGTKFEVGAPVLRRPALSTG